MSNRQNPLTGVGLAVGSMFISQFGGAASVPLLHSEGVTSGTALRLGFAALFCILWARPNFLSFDAHQWCSASALGFFMAVMAVCFYVAETRILFGAAMTIEFLGPLALAALSLRGLKRLALPMLAVSGVAARLTVMEDCYSIPSACCSRSPQLVAGAVILCSCGTSEDTSPSRSGFVWPWSYWRSLRGRLGWCSNPAHMS